MSDLIALSGPGRTDRGVATDVPVDALLENGAPVALGVSGGKDSCALAFATVAHLDTIGHKGPRTLIHSDLGRVEWRDSYPTCERLAAALDLPLLVVRRTAGDMMDRWLTRWANNVARYADLSCVRLILPWSTPSMRFCTSELKTAVICRELIRQFPGQTIISGSGIRRQESSKRKLAPIAKTQAKLTSEWTAADVFALLAERSFRLHEAYTTYGMSRVSCAFCIMSNASDLRAATTCPDNADLYREMVDLEIASTFAFQAGWLGDVAPMLLTDEQRNALALAKCRAARREAAEARIPKHLLFEKGWPRVMPTASEARMLCEVRIEVADAVGLRIAFTEPDELRARYAALMAENEVPS